MIFLYLINYKVIRFRFYKNKSMFLDTESVTVDIILKSWNQIESYIFDTYNLINDYNYV